MMLSDRYLSFYGGHRDEIHCLVFSRDLDVLLTGSIHGCIRLWNTVLDHLTVKIQEHKGKQTDSMRAERVDLEPRSHSSSGHFR